MTPILVDDMVKDILTARVYDVAVESALEYAPKISALTECKVYLKREDTQAVHSFKLRGAYNKIAQLTPEERENGVIAASAGNHAQGVALSAQKLGITALIIMPKTTPSIKVDAVKSFGADVELYGDNYSEAAEYCKQRVAETGRTFIHPFDDPLVIAGQGTIGREILEQLPGVTHIFVPIGGGGLISGVATYVKSLMPAVRIIGVEPVDSNAMQQSIAAEKRVELSHVGIFADGVAVKQVGTNTFTAVNRFVDEIITVNTDQICAAIKSIFEDTRSIVEPAGALAVAGIQSYPLSGSSKAVAICSGANMTFERLQQVAERTLIGSGKEALYKVVMPEKPGALQKFCKKVVGSHAITEFSYRFRQRSSATVFVGISVSGASDRDKLSRTMTANGFVHTDLSDDDTTKEHVRHMIGGLASGAEKEYCYEVTFPERPGALASFLAVLGAQFNISLFHYRSTASDTGSVLIGFEASARAPLEKKLASTGFSFSRAEASPGMQAFVVQKG